MSFARRTFGSAVLFAAFSCISLAQTATPTVAPLPVVHVEHGPNSAAAQAAHYVVLVSLDGFRWDYVNKYNAPHLRELAKAGVWAADGMIPSYPSLTFPNHFTLVTGLYPEHHGLVANAFYDAQKNARYAISDAKAVADGSWYTGTPLWSLAEQQGMRTACLFWPGSEATIAGEQPTYYLKFDDKLDAQKRLQQIIAWLQLPPAERPHLLTLYFSSPDHEGHSFGPDAPETAAAVERVDGYVGQLKSMLDKTGLPIDLVVVSDHGMTKIQGGWVTLDQFADLSGFVTEGAQLYGKTEADRERVYQQLKHASPQFVVYRLKDVPAYLNFNRNERAGDPVVIPTGPYAIRAHGPEAGKPDKGPIAGTHGFDPRQMADMKASFYATGPDLAVGVKLQPFENVNVYPLLAHLLGLSAPKTDGDLRILLPALRVAPADTELSLHDADKQKK